MKTPNKSYFAWINTICNKYNAAFNYSYCIIFVSATRILNFVWPSITCNLNVNTANCGNNCKQENVLVMIYFLNTTTRNRLILIDILIFHIGTVAALIFVIVAYYYRDFYIYTSKTAFDSHIVYTSIVSVTRTADVFEVFIKVMKTGIVDRYYNYCDWMLCTVMAHIISVPSQNFSEYHTQ